MKKQLSAFLTMVLAVSSLRLRFADIYFDGSARDLEGQLVRRLQRRRQTRIRGLADVSILAALYGGALFAYREWRVTRSPAVPATPADRHRWRVGPSRPAVPPSGPLTGADLLGVPGVSGYHGDSPAGACAPGSA